MIQVCIYKKGWGLFPKCGRDGRNGKITGGIDEGIPTKRKSNEII
jgi:hypothetical protein